MNQFQASINPRRTELPSERLERRAFLGILDEG
jgi:hypothetical protein